MAQILVHVTDEGEVATSVAAGGTTLECTQRDWPTNVFGNGNYIVSVLGQVRIITSNTSDTLTVTTAWTSAITAGQRYVIIPMDSAKLAEHEYTTATISGINVGSATTLVLAANTSRKYAVIGNDSDTIIYLALGTNAVINQGIRLPIGGSYEISWLNLYRGAINGIHSVGGASKVATVLEGT